MMAMITAATRMRMRPLRMMKKMIGDDDGQ